MKKDTDMNENSARRAAWKWFEKHGFEDHAGLVLHHKDTQMKSRDYKRYAQWRHGDLVPMTVQEHRRLHMKLEQSRRTRTREHNGRISEGVKNAERGRTIVISRSETLEFRTMAQAAEYIGCSKQLVSQVLNPHAKNRKARGWTVEFSETEGAE